MSTTAQQEPLSKLKTQFAMGQISVSDLVLLKDTGAINLQEMRAIMGLPDRERSATA